MKSLFCFRTISLTTDLQDNQTFLTLCLLIMSLFHFSSFKGITVLKKIIIYILLNILAITHFSHLIAQDAVAQSKRRKASYHAFVSGKMDDWTHIIAEMEKCTSLSQGEKFELIRYYYGYSAYLIGMKQNKKAKSYVGKGDKLINEILKSEPNHATALAFKGSFLGFKVALNRWRIVTLGPESIRCINRAYKTDPHDIQAITDKANLLYFTPGLFGGNKKESFVFFEKSVAKMESGQKTKDSWFYLALLSLLAEHYEKEGFCDKALVTQQKLLSIEPNLKWLKEKILSKLEVEED